MANARFCEQCGSALSATARFCPDCGFSLTGAAPATAGVDAPQSASRGAMTGRGGSAANTGLTSLLTWILPTAALVGIVGYAILSRGGSAAAPVGTEGPIVTATDISSLSPDERVDRLFNRVMSLASAGKKDSVAFFAPMAVNSFAGLMPLSLHRRYDLGLVLLVSEDIVAARAQADTILKAAPTHLLGLALAMRAANAAGNTAEAKRIGAKFKASLAAERAKNLPEYSDHAPDITEAIDEAEGRRTSRIALPR